MAATIQDRWEDLKDKWETAKKNKSKAEGALESTLKRLEEEFGLQDDAGIDAKLESLVREHRELNAELEGLLQKLETAMGM